MGLTVYVVPMFLCCMLFISCWVACLDHLANIMVSRDFIALLPSQGNAAFFLPYIQRNCVVSLGVSLQQKLVNQCRSQTHDRV